MNPEPTADRITRSQAAALLEIVGEVTRGVTQGHPADATLAAIYRRNRRFGSRDRRLFSDTVFSFFRWKGWLEDVATRDIRAAIVFAHLLDVPECHPAIRSLAREAGLAAEGIRPLGPLPAQDKAGPLHRQVSSWMPDFAVPSLAQLAPPWFRESLQSAPELSPEEYAERLLTAFQSPPPTWIRLRPASGLDVPALLSRNGIEATRHPSLPEAMAVCRGANLQGLAPRFRSGLEIQDLASQAVGRACEPAPGESWWDACAGSGGKTLHLADRLGPQGRILATDVRPAALEELRRRAREDGLNRIIRAMTWDGATQPPPEETFDGVLLDAPCSGLGTWHRNPDARWRIRGDRIASLARLQSTLLDACAPRVRPGGKLVYATCTLTRQENAGVLESFLANHAGFTLAPFAHPLRGSPTPGCVTLQPWDGPCNGMFIASLVRSSAG